MNFAGHGGEYLWTMSGNNNTVSNETYINESPYEQALLIDYTLLHTFAGLEKCLLEVTTRKPTNEHHWLRSYLD